MVMDDIERRRTQVQPRLDEHCGEGKWIWRGFGTEKYACGHKKEIFQCKCGYTKAKKLGAFLPPSQPPKCPECDPKQSPGAGSRSDIRHNPQHALLEQMLYIIVIVDAWNNYAHKAGLTINDIKFRYGGKETDHEFDYEIWSNQMVGYIQEFMKPYFALRHIAYQVEQNLHRDTRHDMLPEEFKLLKGNGSTEVRRPRHKSTWRNRVIKAHRGVITNPFEYAYPKSWCKANEERASEDVVVYQVGDMFEAAKIEALAPKTFQRAWVKPIFEAQAIISGRTTPWEPMSFDEYHEG